jgi:hypothetical protein
VEKYTAITYCKRPIRYALREVGHKADAFRYLVCGQKPYDYDDSSSTNGTCVESIETERVRSQLELCDLDKDKDTDM